MGHLAVTIGLGFVCLALATGCTKKREPSALTATQGDEHCQKSDFTSMMPDCQVQILKHLSTREMVQLVHSLAQTKRAGFIVLAERAKKVLPKARITAIKASVPCKGQGPFEERFEQNLVFDYLRYLKLLNDETVPWLPISSYKKRKDSASPIFMADRFVVFQDERNRLVVVDRDDGAVVKAKDYGTKIVRSMVAITPTKFATFSQNTEIDVWSLDVSKSEAPRTERAELSLIKQFRHQGEDIAQLGPFALLTKMNDHIFVSSYEKNIWVWNINRHPERVIPGAGLPIPAISHGVKIPIRISDAQIFVSGYGDIGGGAKVWNVNSGKLEKIIRFPDPTYGVAIVNENMLIRSTLKSSLAFHPNTGEVVHEFSSTFFGVTPVLPRLDDSLVVEAHSGLLAVRRPPDFNKLFTIPIGQMDSIRLVRLDRDHFLTHGYSGIITVWNQQNPTKPRPLSPTPEGIDALIAADTGQIVVTTVNDSVLIYSPWAPVAVYGKQ